MANIHEIRYYMTYPNHKLLDVQHNRISLEHEKRETISQNLDILMGGDNKLKGGVYRLKFEVISATPKCSKQVWIRISDDLKTIEWSESRVKITGF